MSYRWLLAEHPDPHGLNFARLRQYLLSPAGLHFKAIFIDLPGLFQQGRTPSGEVIDRSPTEYLSFSRGLRLMGHLYASVRCTTVLQIKTMPTAPPGSHYNDWPYDSSGWCAPRPQRLMRP